MEIPEEVLALIFSYLLVCERHSASQVCRKWAEAVTSPAVWYYTVVRCDSGAENDQNVRACQRFQCHIKYLKIVCNQSLEANRKNFIQILHNLSESATDLLGLSVVCIGENPYFYSGQDLLQSVKSVFKAASYLHLRHIDLREMPFTLDDGIIQIVTSRSPSLESLFINNKTFVCKVTSETLQEALRSCPNLSALGLFYASLTENVVAELLNAKRPPFKLLQLHCERMDKYNPTISAEMWQALAERYPTLSVDIELDHTVPAKKIPQILQPTIPVASLELSTFTFMVEQVNFISQNYHNTLKRIVLQTTSSGELNRALMRLASCCLSLEEIHCYCVVSVDVVQAFILHCPRLCKYTLKTSKEPHPWLPAILR
ncbi:F-box/LRR-repeat protein 8 [Chiloscyllium plagiosum]|uniref:F-box/LRR-repeat protein 8 n=1 Tax=Chiloscyllium plagiosum TaxID=36176 RepID=UPI001CB83678|nr:F-box/LRR-repeat protein 8 [Chiloscyllium plagiosum]XP_043563143.1 F-box/LRR-repeat protein 8 [Chiloscyllium plagiosum]XP_043563144.1 F-box/LRR-repeat protein 8 [Chiloscyllium plagiosum]XP_043563145.1 F-box/LRR-repeat protein 8 [Chiloscyllium plagiosum]XP_043563146.1 F-box/LRR-repeat protein 8 [Chiloscyllium plagiosum]XP_043563149.1 F-box/LRR-repeat protein 8 [Chiloscyllium plagiosum]XP_043563150.1 F-box/LRR-repeat protein 8 [Chiloscyllium plagiosum]